MKSLNFKNSCFPFFFVSGDPKDEKIRKIPSFFRFPNKKESIKTTRKRKNTHKIIDKAFE